MSRKNLFTVVLLPVCCVALFGCPKEKAAVGDLSTRAVQQSQITLPGGQPFHLKAKVFEATNPDNDNYNAEIEEWWVAPKKWRRTITSEKFSQTLIVNGSEVSEQLTGDYYPNWLRAVVNGIFDPGAPLHGVDMSKSSDNPWPGGPHYCRRFESHVGIPPVQNSIFSSYCFDDDRMESIGIPGYEMAYSDHKKFGGKLVARYLREYIESGTEVGAKIEELTELRTSDDSLFKVQQHSAELRTITVSEQMLRASAVSSPPMQWPPIEGGRPAGELSVYVCIDREGRIRETYELNSHSPAMSDAAVNQLKQWSFKPLSIDGNVVQVESILTFAYETKIIPKPPSGDSR